MADEKPKLSVGAEQQRKDNPEKLIPNDPAPSVAQALANSKKQVDAAK
jgi:hypothetical protein